MSVETQRGSIRASLTTWGDIKDLFLLSSLDRLRGTAIPPARIRTIWLSVLAAIVFLFVIVTADPLLARLGVKPLGRLLLGYGIVVVPIAGMITYYRLRKAPTTTTTHNKSSVTIGQVFLLVAFGLLGFVGYSVAAISHLFANQSHPTAFYDFDSIFNMAAMSANMLFLGVVFASVWWRLRQQGNTPDMPPENEQPAP
jgi:hypothetical protein